MSKIIKESIDRFFDYSIHVETRTIYIGSIYADTDGESGTDAHMAERAVKALFILDQTPDKPITIIFNNLGGDWYHGMAIYDAINACQNHVTIKVFGMAMSMGSIILQSADERILAPNSRVMIHHGYMGMTQNHSKIFEKWADENRRLTQEMLDIYMASITQRHPDFKRKRLDEMCNFDTILSAQEAIDLGLADRIL